MKKIEVNLIGYWNENIEDPEIIFSIPKDISKYSMCVITIRKLEETKDNTEKKLSRELNKLANTIMRLK